MSRGRTHTGFRRSVVHGIRRPWSLINANVMVAWLSASKSIQSKATTMEFRALMTKGTQGTRISSTLMASLDGSRSTCLMACFGFRLPAVARPWPMAQIASELLRNTPNVASQREAKRLAFAVGETDSPASTRRGIAPALSQ
jgi:hypothetical protein